MAKIKEVNAEPEMRQHHQFLYGCLGCGWEHAFALKSEGGHHEFNGDLEKPTVSPSLVQNFVPGKMCHSFIKDGKIEYLTDCQHDYAGLTIELPDIDQFIEERKLKNTKKQ